MNIQKIGTSIADVIRPNPEKLMSKAQSAIDEYELTAKSYKALQADYERIQTALKAQVVSYEALKADKLLSAPVLEKFYAKSDELEAEALRVQSQMKKMQKTKDAQLRSVNKLVQQLQKASKSIINS